MRVSECGACGVVINEEVKRTTRRLLASLDVERHVLLVVTYQGTAPDVLCAGCCLPTIGMLNGAS